MKHDIAKTLLIARDPAGSELALVALAGGGCGIAMNDRVLPNCRFSPEQIDDCADAFLRRIAPAALAQPSADSGPPASPSLAESSRSFAADAMRKSDAMRARMCATHTRLGELRALRAAAGDAPRRNHA